MLWPWVRGSAAAAPIRIPLRGNVPAVGPVRALLDAAPLQRLRGVRQLGLAHLVYPGATHTRFEHSLGVYAMGARILEELAGRPRGLPLDDGDARCFLAACLLHDVGHYPFSHTLEDVPPDPLGRLRLVRHDERARQIVLGDPVVPGVLERQWGCDPERVCRVIDEGGGVVGASDARLRAMLAGPLNPDRLDYLERDSLHVGVPYGRLIDLDRLLSAMAFSPDGACLCVTRKGVSAVETLIFASYLMYREVYWHHTVRAGQAMVRRAAVEALLAGEVGQEDLVAADDEQAMALLRACHHRATRELTAGLGAGRGIYRRVWSGGVAEAAALPAGAGRDLLLRLAEVDAWEGQQELAHVVRALEQALRAPLEPHHLLVDVAGRGKDLFFDVPVLGAAAASTADPAVSLLAPTLASNFERHAKRLQLLAPAALAREAARYLGLPAEPAEDDGGAPWR